jgi:arylsulfatase A-like enzyme
VARSSRLIASALFLAAVAWQCGDGNLPDTIGSQEVLTDLASHLEPVRPQVLLHTGRRAPARFAHVTNPGEPLVARVTVPTGGALALGFGVGQHPEGTSGGSLRFSVAVDGTEMMTRTLDPASVKRDRRWQYAQIDLAPLAGREVEVTLRTDVVGGGPAAGMPGWTRVHLVRVHRTARATATPQSPNVIVLLVDTLRADALGCYGATPSPTPALDALAGGGTLFEDVVAPAPWTLPSVTSVFTGRYPREHGVITGDDPVPGEVGSACLSATVPTLAALARRAGVTTFGLSANPLVGSDTGLSAGFEEFDSPPASDPARGWFPGHEVNARFARWARRAGDRRFFAYLHYMEVHSPYATATAPPHPPDVHPDVRAGEASRFSRRLLRGERAPTPVELAHLRTLYGHAVAGWDRILDDLLRRLDDLGLRERTVVVLTADHGEEFLEHGHLAHGKQLFEESIRVPLVIVGPGVPRARRHDPAQLVDLLPTLGRMLGAPLPAGLPGVDLLATTDVPARAAFAEARRGILFGANESAIAMVREPPWKLLWAPTLERAALFHLHDDPAERTDRGATDAVYDRLLATARQYWQQRAPDDASRAAPGVVEKLRMLGYAE